MKKISRRHVKKNLGMPPTHMVETSYNVASQIPHKSRRLRANKKILIIIGIEVLAMAAILGWVRWNSYWAEKKVVTPTAQTQVDTTEAGDTSSGKILSTEPVQSFTAAQTLEQIKQTNKNFDLPVASGYSKQTIRYTSSDGYTNDIPVYARVYTPTNAVPKKSPVFAFAPGTTGIGDACAATLEQPAVRNWSNYDSLMAAYVSQGYTVVITDYVGMRDPKRLHTYMVGSVEGRTMLDSVRALRNLDLSKDVIDNDEIFMTGYSQGGHAAFWADAISKKYSKDVTVKGVVGFGPVTSVNETLTDAITANANINWFGPYVLTSYQDWYRRTYPVDKILLPQWSKNLRADALRECIDNVNKYWPNNQGANRSAAIYTPEFIAAAKSGNIANNSLYAQFATDMTANIVGPVKTDAAKLINQGAYDNVVLPRQSRAGYERLCKSGNIVNLREYTTSPYAVQTYNPSGAVDHYQTMNASFKDTLSWMAARTAGIAISDSCK